MTTTLRWTLAGSWRSDQPPHSHRARATLLALYFMHYNFARVHSALKTKENPYPRTPATAAGVADHVWAAGEIIGLLDRSN